MLTAIRRFLDRMTGRGEPGVGGADEIQLAVAALLFHVIAVDGTVLEEERTALIDLLDRHFGLGADEARALFDAAEAADAEAVDLYGFTSVLKRGLDQAERERLIGMMWKMVYADGKVHEFQDNVVWRVAELLGVPSQTRIRLKQAVRGNGG
jgi:uncharacterized tellurite resistance protein B-like protein